MILRIVILLNKKLKHLNNGADCVYRFQPYFFEKMIYRFDKGHIEGKAEKTEEGYIRANAIVTRTGVFLYKNSDGSVRRELRHPDDVFEKKSLDSLKMIPITNGHPEQKLVNADNAKELTIGNTGENIYPDGAHIFAPLVITHKDGVDSVSIGKKELSLGYSLDLEKVEGDYNGERYDFRQRNIRYNHLAIVDKARAGGAARIQLDADDAEQTETKPEPLKEKRPMKKVTLDGIDYDAAPEVANALAKATQRADSLDTEKKEVQTKLDAATTELEKTKAERDDLKEKVETKTDGEEIQKAVKARIDLERVAGKVLNKDTMDKISDMSDVEIRKAVILEKNPKANLDEQSDVYIQARFDAVAEEIGSEKTLADQRKSMNERNDGTMKKEDADGQSAAFDGLKNMYKKETK